MDWKNITQIGFKKSYLQSSTWPYDKYADMPTLKASSKVTLLDVTGPGYVSCIHVSAYPDSFSTVAKSDTAKNVLIRVWYDNEKTPAIEMPFMDFLADVDCKSQYFSTLYFSKVRESHNFKLPMPFREKIRIEIENTSDKDLVGYSDVQWEKVDALAGDAGYLKVAYSDGECLIPQNIICLADIQKAGNIVAHWLQYEADDKLCDQGECMCEGNQEFYIDGEKEPSVEYLGTEDVYGFSWGFKDIQSDFYNAIIRRDNLVNGGARIALLRCRQNDSISFGDSCNIVLNYQHDVRCPMNSRVRYALEKGGISLKYKSCFYYYAKWSY